MLYEYSPYVKCTYVMGKLAHDAARVCSPPHLREAKVVGTDNSEN